MERSLAHFLKIGYLLVVVVVVVVVVVDSDWLIGRSNQIFNMSSANTKQERSIRNQKLVANLKFDELLKNLNSTLVALLRKLILKDNTK